MSSHDEAERKAGEVLPCEWIAQGKGECGFEELCTSCQRRPAVAALLREQGAEMERLQERINELENSFGQGPFRDGQLQAELASLRSRLEEVAKRFPCGHRVVDWDDGYGECVVCKIKVQAYNYDKLLLDVIKCHDRIEELEAQVQAACVKALSVVENPKLRAGSANAIAWHLEQGHDNGELTKVALAGWLRDVAKDYEAIAALLREREAEIKRLQAEAANWKTSCSECGPNVSIDEDGLCVSCGSAATGKGVERVESLRQQLAEAKAQAQAARVEALRECLELATKGWDHAVASSISSAIAALIEQEAKKQ